MNIGGLQKNSFIDYPRKVSCVIFLAGCNFDCPFCHNPGLVKPTPQTTLGPDEVLEFLAVRRTFLDGVVISGGEPTLQKELPALCKAIKEMGYPIKLDTNGSRPEVIQGLLEDNLIDYIAMDLKTDPRHYSPVIQKGCRSADILKSIDVIMQSAPAYEFRTTCIKALINPDILQNIVQYISGAMRYVLQHFENKDILHPEFFHPTQEEYTLRDLYAFQPILSPWVKECLVR